MPTQTQIPEKILELTEEVWCRDGDDGLSLWLIAKAKSMLSLDIDSAVRKADETSLELLCQALWQDERLLTVYRHLNCMLAD